MTKVLLIALAGGFGSVMRYLISGWTQRFANGSFPVGTLCVNVLGCLLIGFLSGAFSGRLLLREEVRIAIVVGFIGGFTTFSAFGFETFSLVNDGETGKAVLNVVLSLGLTLPAVWLGYRVAENWLGV